MATNQQVIEFLNKLEHPLKQEIEVVRQIILGADPQFTEHIKWNAPSFCISNEDRITFNLHGDKFFRLIFHCGAKVKVNQSQNRLMDDTTGLLDWASPDRAIVKFTDMNDVEAKREKLVEVVIKWIEVSC